MKLVVKQHRPWRRLLLAVLFTGGAALAIAVALDYGHWKSIATAKVSTGNKRTLLEEVDELRRENASLRYELKRLRRSEEINRATRQENHAQLVELQDANASLNQELEFYREVVAGTEVEAGPKVRGIRLETLSGAGRYRYRVVLTHVDKDDRVAEGVLNIGFRGELGGKRTALQYSDVKETGPENLDFRFKHFRLFEGTIRMPDGFVPEQVQVAVRSRRSSKGSYSETYDWASILN